MAKRRILLGLLVAATLAPVSMTAHPCTSKVGLKEYLKFQHLGSEVLVLDLDHHRRSGWWKGWTWNGHALGTAGKPDFELGSEDQPHLIVPYRFSGQILVVVTDTNPLLYTTRPVKATEVEREDLANVQQLAGLLGNLAGSALQLSAQREVASIAQATEAGSGEATSLLFYRPLVTPADAQPGDEKVPAEVVRSLDAILAALAEPRRDFETAVKALNSSAGSLERALSSFADTAAQADHYLREVELGRAERRFERWPSFAGVNKAFAELRRARAGLAATELPCADQLTALTEALDVKIRGLSADPIAAGQRAKSFDQAVEKLVKGGGDCALRVHLQEVARWLETSRPGPSPANSDVRSKLLPLHTELSGVLGLVVSRTVLLKKADELLAKQAPLGKEAQRFAIVAQRQHDYLGGQASICALNHGVLPVPRAEGYGLDVPWSRFASETFKVTFDPAFAGAVIPTRPSEVEATYELESRPSWFDLDVDLGLIHTDVRDPKFTAVTSPLAEEGDADPPKVIARTGEDSRSGTVAAFVTLLPWQRGGLRLGPQLGVALDTDNPALFLGLSLGNRYVKLNGGYSWHDVDELRRGQELGVTEVGSTDDIRTRRTFEGDWYLGLSLSIDNLDFFGGGD
jgi:hypothetical protein